MLRARGFSLIEALVAMAIMGLLMSLALPSFSEWAVNAQVRATAEMLQSGLQYARAEAVRRNALVRLQLTTSLDKGCALSTSGPHWVVNKGSASPAGACGQAISDSSEPYLLRKSETVRSNTVTVLSASRSALGFDGLGRLASLGGSNDTAIFSLDVSASNGSCQADGGTVHCLRVLVMPGGQVQVCDPSQSSTSSALYCHN